MRADLDAMINLARCENPDALDDPELRDRIARAYTDIEYTRLLNYRALIEDPQGREELARGAAGQAAVEPPGPDAGRAGLRPARPGGRARPRAAPTPSTAAAWNRLYVFQRYTSIGAGTTEVQKNIIADKAIKLPRK